MEFLGLRNISFRNILWRLQVILYIRLDCLLLFTLQIWASLYHGTSAQVVNFWPWDPVTGVTNVSVKSDLSLWGERIPKKTVTKLLGDNEQSHRWIKLAFTGKSSLILVHGSRGTQPAFVGWPWFILWRPQFLAFHNRHGWCTRIDIKSSVPCYQ